MILMNRNVPKVNLVFLDYLEIFLKETDNLVKLDCTQYRQIIFFHSQLNSMVMLIIGAIFSDSLKEKVIIANLVTE